ncbi:unnamed protein product, partial [Mycena citricolor]
CHAFSTEKNQVPTQCCHLTLSEITIVVAHSLHQLTSAEEMICQPETVQFRANICDIQPPRLRDCLVLSRTVRIRRSCQLSHTLRQIMLHHGNAFQDINRVGVRRIRCLRCLKPRGLERSFRNHPIRARRRRGKLNTGTHAPARPPERERHMPGQDSLHVDLSEATPCVDF